MTHPTLAIGTFLKGPGFTRAFALDGVKAYAGGQAGWDRAVANGHETAWALNPGSSITDEPMAIKQAKRAAERAAFNGATVVNTGDVFIIEGVAQVCRVNGERFSDAIVFRPAK